MPPERPRNDPAQYEDLAGEWWRPDGAFAALHWLADVRARSVPAANGGRPLLLDVGCGGGLLAPHVRGYRHVGLDLSASALTEARRHGVEPVRADALRLPVRDGCADVVVAGELLEHVADVDAVVGEIARVLRPGGVVVMDTINSTWWSRFSLVTVGERMPGGPPPRIHDPALFVPPDRVRDLLDRHGIDATMRGLRVSFRDYARFLLDRGRRVRMLPTRSLSAIYQVVGRKEP
ncbi:MAG TPA: methyltransferase domain-containing protein [Actinomycetota bacterium]|nr:methyltransferase domain-containing protein [Actinomycetota bacterium]